MIDAVFVDMDGVLVDFHAGAMALHGRRDVTPGHSDLATQWGMSREAFYRDMDAEFWAQLPWTEHGQELLEKLEALVGQERIVLFSKHQGAESAFGKIRWLERCCPRYVLQSWLGWPKFPAAAPGKVLLDDTYANVHAFKSNQGQAILVPSPWNIRYREAAQAVTTVLYELDYLR